MKVDVCDLCFTDTRHMVAAETMVLSIDGQLGEIEVCPTHRTELQEVLTPFIGVSRIAPGDNRRCPECGFMSATKDAASKHRRLHEQARERQRALQTEQRHDTVPAALAATG